MSTKTKLLVVDDDPGIRDLFKQYLEVKGGYEVVVAEGAEDGMQAAISARPQLVIVDLMLVGRPGLALIRELRGHPDLKHLPIVVCSARPSIVDRMECLDSGANAFFPKPMDMPAIRAKIDQLLGR
jgi:DNA-binding response OmpR family regulator